MIELSIGEKHRLGNVTIASTVYFNFRENPKKWLLVNSINYKTDVRWNSPGTATVYIFFEKESDEILFKLTWL